MWDLAPRLTGYSFGGGIEAQQTLYGLKETLLEPICKQRNMGHSCDVLLALVILVGGFVLMGWLLAAVTS